MKTVLIIGSLAIASWLLVGAIFFVVFTLASAIFGGAA
jgi:hypothetical protein